MRIIAPTTPDFGAGLLDALGQVVLDRQSTLLIAYDSEYPEPLFAKRPVPTVYASTPMPNTLLSMQASPA